MLEYRLDDLHWSEFEALCQALLKATLGVGVESWGGSGDWGVDAYCRAALRYPGSELQTGPFQFQVKFVEGANSAGAKPHGLLSSATQRECERIIQRGQPPPAVYSLLTNVVPSVQLRTSVEHMIRQALPSCNHIIIHGGNDICAWLHNNREIVRSFPKLISYRDLIELRSVFPTAQGSSTGAAAPTGAPEISPVLKEKKERARKESRKENRETAVPLWNEVREQAIREENKTEEIRARIEILLAIARDNPVEALAKIDECLEETRKSDIGEDKVRLLQLIGEVHRISGHQEQARGFIMCALESARDFRLRAVEGTALLSLALLEAADGDSTKAVGLVGRAFQAFAAQLATGDPKTKESAKDGHAQCHFCLADLMRRTEPENALSEITKAIAIFRELGEDWASSTAAALLFRADLHREVREPRLAAEDLSAAESLFQTIDDITGVAKCHLKAGELMDSVGRRKEAIEQYRNASLIASQLGSEPKAYYFHFRLAGKLMELRKFDDAKQILLTIAGADEITRDQKLDIMCNLCLLAHAANDKDALSEHSSRVFVLIDELLPDVTSDKRRRELLTKKGVHLEICERHEEALQCFRKALDRAQYVGDMEAVADSLYQIRGVMQNIGDKEGEREALEKLLALDEEDAGRLHTSLALLSLAQLNIQDQRFDEAKEQLERAQKLDPDNPVVALVGNDLRSRLPEIALRTSVNAATRRPPSRDLRLLVQELHDWCDKHQDLKGSILLVWYYIHRDELQAIFRSMLGAKFLICTSDVVAFGSAERCLHAHGDLFVWGTNFPLKETDAVDIVPVPDGFVFPAGVRVVTPEKPEERTDAKAPSASDSEAKSSVLVRKLNPDFSAPYHLFFLADPNSSQHGVRPVFAGRRREWRDSQVIDFMLRSRAAGRETSSSICLPLSEHDSSTNLGRVLQLARDAGAVPIFIGDLPNSTHVNCVCDSFLELPKGCEATSAKLKEEWADLISSSADDPKRGLIAFKREVGALSKNDTARISSRIYQLHYRTADQEFVYPAVVVTI
jgi:tetratricopeptide (TPR) repeat protein